ncbi:MAG: class I SAM-dependent methyltransferase [Candidatus Binatia bacterium]
MSLTDVNKTLHKTSLLLSLLPKYPLEFYDRVRTILDVRLEKFWVRQPSYDSKTLHEAALEIGGLLGVAASSYEDDVACNEIAAEVGRKAREIAARAPFSLSHNADFTLARMCYLACRMFRPRVVLETGVAYGVTSAFILKALELNDEGVLHSVDLPPLGCDADQFVGILIPDRAKRRWRLHRGVSKRVLPSLLPQLGLVNIFVHDSLHTYSNILWELQMVAPYLTQRCIVIADDIDGNHAFHDWATRVKPAFWTTVQEEKKESVFGVSVLL